MKKHRKHKQKAIKEPVLQNPVAKYARQFNKAQVFKDKTKYQRKAKHQGMEPFIMSFFKAITKSFMASDSGLSHALTVY